MFTPLAISALASVAPVAAGNNVAFAALIWWVIPAAAIVGAVTYVVWVSKFKDKYSNETNRSVNSFSRFQNSFRDEPPAPKDGPSAT
jgi:hypothetical protein